MAAPRRRASASRNSSWLTHPLVRRAGILLAVSFGLSLLLVAYLFGFDGFFGRLMGATFVWFVLLGVTFLAVVPFVNWAADNWFGRSWAEHPTPQPARKPRASNTPKTPATPKPTRYAPRTPTTSD
ncbi:magnesium transporter [Hymenobacter jeollabukensis]|uniref:Magnesium transporter n=1 Tax=Hymenobacter jeollabukensis TaxID=2025313 RepID=A0A5R8WM37_9BACT|nr:magnesium transporter [Hymenobacter jeollabukensis]TLM90427.1 magnesium transporter [Hymenobacter jeollabukensis]